MYSFSPLGKYKYGNGKSLRANISICLVILICVFEAKFNIWLTYSLMMQKYGHQDFFSHQDRKKAQGYRDAEREEDFAIVYKSSTKILVVSQSLDSCMNLGFIASHFIILYGSFMTTAFVLK